MKTSTITNILVVSLISCFYMSCSSSKTALQDYISSHKYTPFDVPRDDWGTGTIVRFEDKTEYIVARRDQCFYIKATDRDTSRVALEDLSYILKKDNSVELNLSKALSSSVDLQSAVNSTSISKVAITMEEPFEVVLPEISAKQHFNKLSEDGNNLCLEEATSQDNFIITRILGVKGVEYSFYNEKNQQLSLDSSVLDLIGIEGESQRDYVGNTSLKIKHPVFVGYRLWRANTSAGLLESEITLDVLTPKDINKLKQLDNN